MLHFELVQPDCVLTLWFALFTVEARRQNSKATGKRDAIFK